MAANGMVVIKLSDLVDGQEAVCFAALVKKTRGMTKSNQPYLKCLFRDKRVALEAPLWHDQPVLPGSRLVDRGDAYRLQVHGRLRPPLRHADRHPGRSTRDR